MTSQTPERLLHALLLDRKGGATAVAANDIEKWRPDDGLLWLHVDVVENPPREWMQDVIGLESFVVEALTADETRPRSLTQGDGLLAVLREQDDPRLMEQPCRYEAEPYAGPIHREYFSQLGQV